MLVALCSTRVQKVDWLTGNLIRGGAKGQLLVAKSAHESGNMFQEAGGYKKFSPKAALDSFLHDSLNVRETVEDRIDEVRVTT